MFNFRTKTPVTLREKVLAILQWYGESFDPQGWGVEEQEQAADKLLTLFTHPEQDIDLTSN